MKIGTNNWEEEMAAMKACYKSSLKKTKKKRHTSSCRKKRSLD